MHIAVNASTFPADTGMHAMAKLAAQAGFEAIELVPSEAGPLTWQSDQADCRSLAEQLHAAGLGVAALTSDVFRQAHYACFEQRRRQLACQRTIRLLDLAAWIGAKVVSVIPAVVGHWGQADMQVTYGEALSRSFEALSELAFEAEQRAVVLAVENALNRFLLSPVEFREWLDEINSPWVQAYLNVGSALAVGYPQDWAATLAGRIARVRATDYRLSVGGPEALCLPGDGDVDWPAVMNALRDVGYAGPLTYAGPGRLEEIARRLKRLLEL